LVKPGRGSWPYQAMNSSSPKVVHALGDRGRDAIQYQHLQRRAHNPLLLASGFDKNRFHGLAASAFVWCSDDRLLFLRSGNSRGNPG
jgi:hypothetical protein